MQTFLLHSIFACFTNTHNSFPVYVCLFPMSTVDVYRCGCIKNDKLNIAKFTAVISSVICCMQRNSFEFGTIPNLNPN